MSAHRRVVADALEALAIHSTRSYSWLGQLFVRDADLEGDETDALRRSIEGRLYSDLYLAGGVAAPRPVPAPHTGPWPSRVARELSAANTGTGSPEAGWVVVGRDGTTLVVERDGLRVWAERERVRGETPAPGVGDRVALVSPKEAFGRPGGFYAVYGDAGRGPAAEEGPVDRFYWNVRPGGRPVLVHGLTSTLNRADVPFRLKVLSDPRVARCDAGVLYTPGTRRADVVERLAGVLTAVAAHMRPATPIFTRPLAPGLGFAEHPPGAESFGTHRCDLLARGMIRGHLEGAAGADERLRMVEAAFDDAGIRLDHPHLNPTSDPAHDPAPLGT